MKASAVKAVTVSCATVACLSVIGPAVVRPAAADPPTPPSASQARTELQALTVRAEGSTTGYSRDRFPHWRDQGNSCNTREVVLKRDGDNVKTDSRCYPISGSWTSPYDGATWTQASDVDIDHMVPLAESWRSGTSSWDDSKRGDFANDLTHAQLWAVTDNVNQAKGDKDPAEWKPPRTAIWCLYARAWIDVKYQWKMNVDSAEKSALNSMLDRC